MFFSVVILNLLSSYFIASIFKSVLMIFISYFALVVLNMEILSLFSAISPLNIFIISVLNFIISLCIFLYKKPSVLTFSFDFKRFKNALFLDKSLIILFFAWCFLILTTLFLSLIMPSLEPDSQTYHFIRAVRFFENGNLNHFETNDIRALIMPINSEIFYTWLYALKANFHGYAILSFFSYFLAIFSLWDIFEKFKYAFRKRLYAIFILSSLSAIIVQMASLQSDIIVGALLLSAVALFIKNRLFASSLALSLALGTKTTAFAGVFSIFIFCTLYEILICKNKKICNTIKLFLYLIANFLIFSSYNYILNFIQYHSFTSNQAAYLGHRFWGGIKGYISNLIHFFFQAFDFTGFKWGYYLNNKILALKESFFNFIGINPLIGCNVAWEKVNIIADEQIIGFGILGFLVYLPFVFYSLLKVFFNKNKKTVLCAIFALIFIINILLLSRLVAYMIFSIRFVVAFVILSSVILINVYSKKNFLKPVILFFCLFYMLLLSTHIKRMPFGVVVDGIKKSNFNLEKFEDECYKNHVVSTLDLAAQISDTIEKKYSDKKNIALVKSLSSSLLYLKKLEKKGYKIDFLTAGALDYEKLKKYDLIILENEVQNDNIFDKKDVIIRYHIEDEKVIFDKGDFINCYYVYVDNNSKYLKPQDAIDRICFSYPYMLENPDFNLDYKEVIKTADTESYILNMYYFVQK